MRNGTAWLTIAALSLAVTLSNAQVTTGTISGTVSDSTGAVLPGAKVEILSEGTGAVRTVTSDAAGHYIAPTLSVGSYRVAGSLEGFQSEIRTGIVLTIGREAVVDLKLSVGAVSQSVEVTGEASLVQTTESTVSYLVGDRAMRDLPLNGRDMSQLILLNPGVTLSVNSTGNNSYSGYGKRISIAGMRGEDNIYILDGGLIGDFRRHIPAGPSGSLLGLETVQEFQVLTNSLGAQYGRVLGGVFNAVSKSGTNAWHGDAYDFLRNSALDARNFFDRKKLPSDPRLPSFRRNQFGGTFGGPIRKDKMFFFVAYEGTREALTQTLYSVTIDANARLGLLPGPNGTTTTVPIPELMKPYIAAFPLPSPQGRNLGGGTAEFIQQFTQPTAEDFGQARFDYLISANDTIFARYSGSNSFQDSGLNGTVGYFPGFEVLSSLGSSLATVSETHIFSPTVLNTVRIHFNRVNPLDTGKFAAIPPGVQIVGGLPIPMAPVLDPGSGVTPYGGVQSAPTHMVSNRFTYQDDVNWTKGEHSMQFGGFLERLQFNGTFWNRAMGIWTAANLTNFLQGRFQTFRGAPPGFGTYERSFRSLSFASYIQDNWRVTSKLTLNLGLRWEPYTVPVETHDRISNLRHVTDTQGSVGGPYWLNSSWKNVAPRLGFAWTPFASGKTSLRGGVGLFYEPNDPNLYYTQMVRNPPLAYDFTIPDTGHFPDALAEIRAQSTQGPGYALPYDNMREPHAYQWNLTLQHQIGASNVVSVGYAGSRGINLLTVGDINMPRAFFDGVSLAFRPTDQLVNPVYSSIVLYANNANSSYHGLLTSYQRRFAHGFQAQVSYTFSKGLSQADSGQTAGGVTGGGGRTKYPSDMHAQNGLSGYHFKDVFTFNYSYDLPFAGGRKGIAGRLLSGWQTTGVLNLRDGQPQSVTAGVATALVPLAVTPASPNSVAGCKTKVNARNPNNYFDKDCFTPAGPREIGNLARNTLIGPGSVTWDTGLFKKVTITERMNLEFRAEAFNILNRANFGPPASNVFTSTPANGVFTSDPRVASAGRITVTTTKSRQIQFALKLLW